MFYHLIYPLHATHDYLSVLNVFRYITVRTAGALLTAFFVSLIAGPAVIRLLTKRRIGQVVRDDGPKTHAVKAGTPTMGGAFILVALIVSMALWGNFKSPYVLLGLLVAVCFGAVGFVDDWKKISDANSKGIPGRLRLVLEFALAFGVGAALYVLPDFGTELAMPFFKNVRPEMGLLAIPAWAVVIVGTGNAVNLTDGLDGLAIGPALVSFATFLLLAYLAGNVKFAEYLQITYVPGVGELAVFCGALIGAGMGFLWYNTYPALVFMGDVGSLALGGSLGAVAVMTKNEILLAIVGGVFVAETVSVILQVASFKMTGKRIFLMAPIHHHFEIKGWPEPRIIVRFWLISTLLAMFGLMTLKLR